MYRLAGNTGALSVLGSHCQRIQFPTVQPGDHMGRLGCRVVGTGPAIFMRVDEVGSTTLSVPAYCDVIVLASCHSSHNGWWADD